MVECLHLSDDKVRELCEHAFYYHTNTGDQYIAGTHKTNHKLCKMQLKVIYKEQ